MADFCEDLLRGGRTDKEAIGARGISVDVERLFAPWE